MKLYIIPTPIGNIKDITIRAKEVLQNIDLVLCEDTRVTSLLFNQLQVKCKLLSCHKFNETTVAEKLENLFSEYSNIAYVSDAGTPAISDPGAIIVDKARSMGIEIEALPGASAVVTAVSLSGETRSNGFNFIGFLPREKNKQKELFDQLWISPNKTIVFYESPNRIVNTLSLLNENMIEKICVYNDLTKLHEKHYVGKLPQVLEQLISNENVTKGEYVCVVFLTDKQKDEEKELSLEALIVDNCIKNNITIKEAIASLTKQGNNKNDLYKASLNLKKYFD